MFRKTCLLAALLLPSLLSPPGSAAPLTNAFTYQGELRQGGIVVDQTSDFRFRLFDAPVGGASIGAQNDRPGTAVTRGTFTVSLDFGASAFIGEARWLEIDVRSPAGAGAFVTLAPRVPLTAAPNALFAKNAASAADAGLLDGLDSTAFVKKGEANSVVATMITPNVVSAIDGVANDAGNIDLVAGTNVTITPNDAANTITIAASADGGNAQTIDGLDSAQFLRADGNDSIATGTVYTVSGAAATLTIGGGNLQLNLGDSAADTVTTSGPIEVNGVLDAGNNIPHVAYNRVGNGTTSLPPNWAGSGATDANDLYVSDVLEVENYLFAGTIVVPSGGTGIFWETTASGVQSLYHSTIEDKFVLSHDTMVNKNLYLNGFNLFDTDVNLYFEDGDVDEANFIRWDDVYDVTNACGNANASGFVWNITDNTQSSWFFANGSDVELEIDELGNVAADGTIGTGIACDLAENFLGDADLEPGTVVRADPSRPEGVVETTVPYDAGVVGVVSTQPGFLLSGPTADAYPMMAELRATQERLRAEPANEGLQRRQEDLELALETWTRGEVAVALAGRVPVKVVGRVAVGEPLTSSAVPGHAMAMTKEGPSIGIALSAKQDEGPGTVVVLAQGGWRRPLATTADEEREDATIAGGGAALVDLRERLARLETQVLTASPVEGSLPALGRDGRDGVAGSDARDGRDGDSSGAGGQALTRLEKEAWGDFDADGKDDVLVLAPLSDARLLRNLGDGRFEDVTAAAGLGDTAGTRIGLWGDVDGDRRQDLLLVDRDGAARLALGNGAGRFQDVTRSFGLDFGRPIVAASFLDHDHDGLQDLRVELADGTILLHHNLGGGAFEETLLREPVAAVPADRLASLEEENAALSARLAAMEALVGRLLDAQGSQR